MPARGNEQQARKVDNAIKQGVDYPVIPADCVAHSPSSSSFVQVIGDEHRTLKRKMVRIVPSWKVDS